MKKAGEAKSNALHGSINTVKKSIQTLDDTMAAADAQIADLKAEVGQLNDEAARRPKRVLVSAAHDLSATGLPADSIAAARRCKSSPGATAGGKGA